MSLPDPTTAPPWLNTGVRPTDQEFEDWMAITSPGNRHWYLDRLRKASDQGHQCWNQGHEDRIEYLDNLLRAANARIDFLERNYRKE